MNKTIRNMALISVMAALICVLAPVAIPVGTIPITLATFVIYITAALLGPKRGTFATLLYIAIGMIGVPVFSAYRSGFGVVLGATGGYIIGYIPLAFISGLFVYRNKKNFIFYPLGMVVGTFVLYTVGTIWYMVLMDSGLVESLLACVVPFLLFDLIKIIIASLIVYLIHQRIEV